MSNSQPLFFPADAHEGCVWVAAQQRLYFTTTKNVEAQKVDLNYFDLSGFNLREPGGWSGFQSSPPDGLEAKVFVADLSMANSFCLSGDGKALLVAEQGDLERPSVVSRIDLFDKRREVLIDNYLGKPFNSINKVYVTKQGHLIFSDPDYGFRQGFRPPPALEPSIYLLTNKGELHALGSELDMPHGLVLSPDESTLFITDTSYDGAHSQAIEKSGNRAVYAFDFDPDRGLIGQQGRKCFATDAGVPDGCITTKDELLVGGGDGVYVANLNGALKGKIRLDRTAVNLCAVGKEDAHLFVTADEGVYFIADWREKLKG